MSQYHSCETCKHVDMIRGVHPVRCCHPSLNHSMPVAIMRSTSGPCSIVALMWEKKNADGR